MEKNIQKTKKGGDVSMNRQKRPTFLVSVAIPLLFTSSFFSSAVDYVGSLVVTNSYAEEQMIEENGDPLGEIGEQLKKEGIEYVPVEHESPTVLSKRVVTAYNAVPEQTNDRPCEGAFTPHTGINFCKTNLPIVATNELPLGTLVKIDDRIFLVADRTNSRYKYRYDILTPTLSEAREWGKRTHIIEVIGKVVKNENS
ncbi:MAG: hypothetical protein COU47_02630 [Candidatus Niyogibacteria bacterium CG10_big_fil_rev_8_21_14_0_10_46_36]|uniref:3D domain-containing protein n=1 Tax=Candidatus Niyogibacteria bacterium CG10_big_fil_rev_8_21_14_0_10_46_36 TaxID=1974726 RepID=A0A2H0TD13_9BACT|nr:MAG: hypothetical protein COU47_02630 [Candidatus Niyogibacteria bacterium CG10_big_fil_rev_8_21_14_0_10_46_36]